MRRRTTTLGTPAAPSWSAEWLARVEAEEAALGRRICGAVTMGAGPCLLGSDHPSGRCRYHGGVVTVGPPCENQNARIHGLYARRLQRCSSHCPLWKSCPFAGEDVMTLPEPQRPICAYERDEYAALMRFYFKAEEIEDKDLTTENTECTERGIPVDPTKPAAPIDPVSRRESASHWDEGDDEEYCGGNVDPVLGLRFPGDGSECPDPFLLHQLVLLTVMQTRAAAVLSAGTLTDAVEVDSPGYRMKTAKPGAALEAFLRIAREWRALRAMIDTKKLMPKPREMGIGSRLRSLMLLTRKAVQESIEDLDAPEYRNANSDRTTEGTENTEENSRIGNRMSASFTRVPEGELEDRGVASDEDGSVEEASSQVVSSEVVNREEANSEVASSESANGDIDAGSRGAADNVGETTHREYRAASGEVAGPAVESEALSREEPARPEAVRPPPLLWSDVLARRARSRFDDFLFIDRGG